VATWRDLAPPLDIDGPRVRMGIVWGFVTTVACVAGTLPLAAVFALVALAAAGQTCQAWRRARTTKANSNSKRNREPYPPVAIGGAVLMTFGAAAGPPGVAAAALLTTVASLVVSRATFGNKRYDAILTAAIAFVVGASSASVIVTRERLGFAAALILLASVHVVEGSTFIIGSGARHRWEATAAAAAAVAALTLATSAVLVPPFRGASAWVFGAIAIACTGLGRRAASAVLPTPDAPVPALRRLDGFLITGAAWVLVGAAILDVR
jgi:hypothetical protein